MIDLIQPRYMTILVEGVAHSDKPDGRPYGPTWFLNEEFLNSTTKYLHNKFVHIGDYPNYLWLFKDILPEIKEQLFFQDHLQRKTLR